MTLWKKSLPRHFNLIGQFICSVSFLNVCKLKNINSSYLFSHPPKRRRVAYVRGFRLASPSRLKEINNMTVYTKPTYKRSYLSFTRDVYVRTIHPQRKHVLIMIDHGNSLSSNQLHTGKAVARQILASLSENDRVSLID